MLFANWYLNRSTSLIPLPVGREFLLLQIADDMSPSGKKPATDAAILWIKLCPLSVYDSDIPYLHNAYRLENLEGFLIAFQLQDHIWRATSINQIRNMSENGEFILILITLLSINKVYGDNILVITNYLWDIKTQDI